MTIKDIAGNLLTMKLNKQVQYGMLLCLYLSRSGKSTVDTASKNLNVSKAFLDRIANKLKTYGVLKSSKGPGGGFELVEDARMVWVFKALGATGLLTHKESTEMVSGCPEKRATAHYVVNLGLALYPLLNRRVKDIMAEVVANEMKTLGLANDRGLEN